MDQITLGSTLFLSVLAVYYVVKPFLQNSNEDGVTDANSYPDSANENADKLRASRLVLELEELKELYENCNLSESEYEEQRQLLLKDAEEVIS